MGIFSRSQPHRVAAGRTFGRELAHAEHKGWRKLVLLRHGQTDFNVQHRLPGQLPGIPLNTIGQREAQMTAESIRALPLTAIVASPLERTIETAAYVNQGRGLQIRQDRDLLDTNYGPYNGKNWDELDKADPAWQRFTRDPTTKPSTGRLALGGAGAGIKNALLWHKQIALVEAIAPRAILVRQFCQTV
jgi:hypothetical protein